VTVNLCLDRARTSRRVEELPDFGEPRGFSGSIGDRGGAEAEPCGGLRTSLHWRMHLRPSRDHPRVRYTEVELVRRLPDCDGKGGADCPPALDFSSESKRPAGAGRGQEVYPTANFSNLCNPARTP